MAEPAQRRTADDGGRFYEHPTRTSLTGEPVRYISVTTALDVLSKEALLFWATKLSAGRAMGNLPKLIAAARREPCGDTFKRDGSRCGECSACVQRWVETYHLGEKTRRAREGSAVHDVIEWWSKTGEIHYDPSAHLYEQDGVTKQVTRETIQPYLDRFQEWAADFGIVPASFRVCEATVWHHDDLWAGTLDGVLHIEPRTAKAAKLCARIHAANGRTGAALNGPVTVIHDNKTRENPGKAFYIDYALQVGGAYRHAQTITPKLGMIEAEMMRTDGAVVLQLRPDGYSFEPVASGQREYQAFLAALRLCDWVTNYGDASVQVGTFPVPAGWEYRPPGEHVREVTADGDPVEPPKKAARKRAAPAKKAQPAKKAAPTTPAAPATPTPEAGRVPSATLDSMRTAQRRPGAELSDDDIPF